MPNQTLRVAIIGAGFFGATLGRACHNHPGFTVAAISDLNAESGAALAKELDAEFTTDLTMIAEAHDIDLVFIATPNHAHAAPVIAFLRAGKHVFVEKPLAITQKDITNIMDAAATSKGKLLVGHVLRCLPGIRRMHADVTTGALGRVLEGHATRARLVHTPANASDWWKLDRSRTGGELLHEIHELDLLTWFLGEPRFAECVTGAPISAHGATADSVHKTTMTFASGAIGLHEVSTSAHFPQWSIRISGSESTLVADFRISLVTRYVDGTEVETWDLFDNPAANDSLRESAVRKQSYNAAGAASPVWMSQAVDDELGQIIAAITGGESALVAQPDTAARTALAALPVEVPA